MLTGVREHDEFKEGDDPREARQISAYEGFVTFWLFLVLDNDNLEGLLGVENVSEVWLSE